MGKITTLVRLLICGVFLRKKTAKSSHLLFIISPIASNPTSLQFVQFHFFNSLKLFVIINENGHDRITGTYQALSTYLGYMENNVWVTWWENYWFVTLGSSSMTAHQKKQNNDIPNFHSTSTEILFIQPLNPIYFTLWTNGGQPVWPGNSTFWFSVWCRWSCMGALIVKNKSYLPRLHKHL